MGLANNLNTAAKLSQANVMLTVTSDQNLFQNDQIHFAINVDRRHPVLPKGTRSSRSLTIPGKSGASVNIALGQLQNYVSIVGAPPRTAALSLPITFSRCS